MKISKKNTSKGEITMEKLLYESRGIARKSKRINIICSILAVICGIVLIVLTNLKRKTIDFYGGAAGGYQSWMGQRGGGYLLSESGRKALMIIGIIAIAFGIIAFCNMLSSNKSYVKIYEDHIKGLSCAGLFFFTLRKEYDIEYSEIERIQIVRNPMYGDSISIKVHGERYGLILEENADRVLEIITSRMEK